MNLTIFDQGEQIGQEALSIDAASLYRAFERVKDGRKAKGKSYPLALILALILTLILLGKLTGETKLDGIIDWINERKPEIKKLLKWPKKGFPVEKTYTDALAKYDHHEIARTIAQVLLKSRAVE